MRPRDAIERLRSLGERRGMAAVAFLVAAAYWPGIFAASSMPRWWAMALGLPLASPLDPRALRPGAALCLLIGVACAASSLLISPDPQGGALELWFLVLLAGAAIAGAGLVDAGPVIAAFAWGVAISCILAVPQSLGWSPVPQSSAPAGTFLSSEVLGEIAAPLAIWAAYGGRRSLFAILALGTLLTSSRIGLAAFCVGALAAWPLPNRWARPLLAAVLVTAAIASIVAFGEGKAASGLSRMVLWGAAVESITPLGRGLGWWAAAHPATFQEFAHSDALQLVIEVGPGSLFLFAVPVVALWRRRDGDDAERAALAALCFEAIASFPLHLPASGFLLALLAGWMARAGDPVRVPRLASGEVVEHLVRRPVSLDGGVGIFGSAGPEGVPVRSAPAVDRPPGPGSGRSSPPDAGGPLR